MSTAEMRATIEGSGAPVVLLHGIPGSSRSWRHVAPTLQSAHTVVVPDLLGFGASARVFGDALSAEAQSDALATLLDRHGISGATIAGHDYGGPVALTLSQRRPDLVAGLALFATNAFPDTHIPFPISMVTWPAWGSVAERMLFSGPSLAAMLRFATGKPRPDVAIGAAVGDRAQRRAIREIFAGALRELRPRYEPVEQALRAFPNRIFVGWGDRDPFFPVAVGERIAAAAKDATFKLYEGAGHLLPEERAGDLAADIARLAAEVRSR